VKIKNNEVALIPKNVVKTVWHASLQPEEWVKEQAPGGFSPVFSFAFKDEHFAKAFVLKLKVFRHATSLGG